LTLQQILFYRAPGLTLDDIAKILAEPGQDAGAHLRRQHRLLREQISRYEGMLAAADPRAMDIAERHREHITRWFYDGTYEMHRGLAEMYVADERFTQTYDAIAPGLARYTPDAALANADRATP
jgi:MerR family transcriptional regulator, thiopeptide resistance regulator